MSHPRRATPPPPPPPPGGGCTMKAVPGAALLLLLIGTARSQQQDTSMVTTVSASAADQQDSDRASWRLPMADQRMLGVCLHMYLERDFPAIERIVYPAPRTTVPSVGVIDERTGARVLVDGPGLEVNCRQLSRLLRCFSHSLVRMQYYENFSEFRRLVVALDAVLLELCGAVDLMRHRFLPLLQTLNCIERVRAKEECPFNDRLPPNIWHQLIRLEVDSSLCWPLEKQLHCVRDSGAVRARCGETAQHLFTNLSSVFLGHWCLNAGSSFSKQPVHVEILLVFLPVLSIFSESYLNNVRL